MTNVVTFILDPESNPASLRAIILHQENHDEESQFLFLSRNALLTKSINAFSKNDARRRLQLHGNLLLFFGLRNKLSTHIRVVFSKSGLYENQHLHLPEDMYSVYRGRSLGKVYTKAKLPVLVARSKTFSTRIYLLLP